jgi:hypothetical protein
VGAIAAAAVAAVVAASEGLGATAGAATGGSAAADGGSSGSVAALALGPIGPPSGGVGLLLVSYSSVGLVCACSVGLSFGGEGLWLEPFARAANANLARRAKSAARGSARFTIDVTPSTCTFTTEIGTYVDLRKVSKRNK